MITTGSRTLGWLTVMTALGYGSAARLEAQSREPGLIETGETVTVQLSFVRGNHADDCIDAQALRSDVVERLGRDPFGPEATQHIEAMVARDGSGFTVQLWHRDRSGGLLGSRTLRSEDPDCRSLEAALGLLVALTIDPDAMPTAPDPVAPPEGERTRHGVVEPESAATAIAPTPTLSTAPTAREAPGVAAHFILANGLVPGWAPGIGVVTDAPVAGAFRWHLGVLHVPESQTQSVEADFGFVLTSLVLGSCVAALRFARLVVNGCVDVLSGSLTAVVHSPDPTDAGSRLWAAGRLGAGIHLSPVRSLVLSLSMHLVAPFVRHRFRIEGEEATRFQQPAVIPLAQAGVGLRFQ